MIEGIKNIFRRRAIRKNACSATTVMLPLSEIKTAVTIIDAADPTFDDCKEAVLSFYREYHIKGDIFFLDFRKITNDELLITSIQTTILKRDLNWYGRPSGEKMAILLGSRPDLFISLVKGRNFTMEYMAACSNARFKAGRNPGQKDVLNLIVHDAEGKEMSQKEIFKEMKGYLKKII